MREIHRSPYMSATVRDDLHLVVIKRSATPYPSTDELKTEIAQLAQMAVDFLKDGTWLGLIDTRDGPLRNDPEFEKVAARLADLQKRFRRSALLVKTAVGRLQVQRLNRERGAGAQVFENEDEAMAYLLDKQA